MNNKILYVITAVWVLFFIGIYALGLFERPTTFNELGDFLAGLLAPVALFWIIAGYNQQSKALKISMDSLNIQNTLMKRNQTKLEPFIKVETNLIEPFIMIDQVNDETEKVLSFSFKLEAEKNDAREIEIFDINGIMNIERKNELKRDEEFEFYISSDEFKRNIFFKDGKNLEFKIRYQSILGDVKEDFYKFKIIEKDGEYKYMPASLSKRNHATKRFY